MNDLPELTPAQAETPPPPWSGPADGPESKAANSGPSAGRASAATELTGRVHTVIYLSDDKEHVIARLDRDGGPCVCGPSVDEERGLAVKVDYRFVGTWHVHPQHGDQFRFVAALACEPHDRAGVVAYLVALAPGVGAKRAARLYEEFRGDAVRVLREQPDAVVAAGIMSQADADEASQALHDESAFESVKVDLLGLFSGRGFQAGKLIKACLAKWGAAAAERVRDNPYLLMLHRLPSAGFKRCDKLYLDRGYPAAALKRQMLSGWHFLKTDSTGHTWFPADAVGRAIADSVSGADPLAALRLGIRAKWLTVRKVTSGPEAGVYVAESKKAANEANVALSALRLLGGATA